MTGTVAIFGAGKIGRSFIAQIFARNGYEIIFIDVDSALVAEINTRGRYSVVTLQNDGSRSEYWVEGVRAIDGRDTEAVCALLAQIPLVVTSVGANAIPKVAVIIAEAARARAKTNRTPFDLIVAENMPHAGAAVEAVFTECALPADDRPGIIEASIGKTSPDIADSTASPDPLVVYADDYNTLIVSNKNWKNKPPDMPELYLTESIDAYVKRKLFIHNFAHCSCAYFGYQLFPEVTYIHELLAREEVRAHVQPLIENVARALAQEYPQEFNDATMQSYLADVLARIANPTLMDDVWRVGQDIPRKIGHDERVVGSMLLTARHNLLLPLHIELYMAALSFRKQNSAGSYSRIDENFYRELCWRGVSHAVYRISQLSDDIPVEHDITEKIMSLSCSREYENKVFL